MNAPARVATPAGDLIGLAEVARLLAVSEATLRRRRARWQRQGMPCPLPWRAAPLLWRRAEIEKWLAAAERRAGARAAETGS